MACNVGETYERAWCLRTLGLGTSAHVFWVDFTSGGIKGSEQDVVVRRIVCGPSLSSTSLYSPSSLAIDATVVIIIEIRDLYLNTIKEPSVSITRSKAITMAGQRPANRVAWAFSPVIIPGSDEWHK